MSWRRRTRQGLIRWLKERGRPALNRLLARYSLVGDPVRFDSAEFPWTAELEAHWKTIRAEAERVLPLREHIPAFQEISPDQYRISPDDRWKTFWLHGFGRRAEFHASLCPETARLVDRVPGLQTAFLSILAPGKHVPPHRGVYKGIINYHLALIVPRDAEACRMRVGDERFHWVEGESRIFDDTREHEVWNDTPEERVVLMLQFERPLRAPGRQLSRLFVAILKRTPYIRVAQRNQAAAEERLRTFLAGAEGGPG